MISRLRDFKNPTLFLVNGLGDQLIALPAIRALGTLFPDGMQLILGPGMYWFFYRGLPWRGEGCRAHWANSDIAELDVERTVRACSPCDLFISLCNWVTPSVVEVARRLGAQSTVGYHNCFDERVRLDGAMHMFSRLFAIPQHFDPMLRFESFVGPPLLSSAAEAAADRYVSAIRGRGERLLFVHAETQPDKMWSNERFSWVLTRFLRDFPDYKVIVTSVRSPIVGLESDRVSYTGAHLELALAMLKRADLFLGVDSCFLHAADLFHLPGVALFGPTSADEWGFHVSARGRCVSASAMDDIRAETVLAALIEVARGEHIDTQHRPQRTADGSTQSVVAEGGACSVV